MLMALVVVLAIASRSPSQDRLRTMPGYERYKKYNSEIPGSEIRTLSSAHRSDDGAAFEYRSARQELPLRHRHENGQRV